MTKIIQNSFKNARCKACDCRLAVGQDVRWTKGGGATCVECPPQTSLPLQQPLVPAAQLPMSQRQAIPVVDIAATVAQLVRDRDAALADGQALRTRIGVQEGEIKALRDALTEARSTITQTVNQRDEARRECAALRADRRVGPLAQLPPEALDEHGPWLGDPAAAPALVEDNATPHPYSDAGYEHALDGCDL